MNYIQTFDGNVKAKGVATDTLFYSSLATDGLEIVDGVVTKYEGTAKKVYIPDYYNGTLVTSIGENAFANNTSIVVVRFPKHLTTIAEGAFYGCTGLVSIDLGENITTIGQDAFVGCTGLEVVTIGTTVLPSCEGAFAIAGTQSCRLIRPFNVDDRDAWTSTFMAMGFGPVNYLTENRAVEYAMKASYDGNGVSLVSNYAKINGNYANMTVGNAVTASKATTTDFTTKTWQTGTSSGVTLTAGTWQLYYDLTLYNVSLGVIYFDGEHATYTSSRFVLAQSSEASEVFVNITANGAVSLFSRVTSGDSTSTEVLDLSKLHYREIK